MQQMLAPSQTAFPGTPGGNSLPGYQQSKHVTYNGADMKRSAADVATPYGTTHRSTASAPRSGNTHNLPPIAALSSYHSNRREPVGKSAQSVQRHRTHSTSAINKSPGATPPASPAMPMPAQRLAEYPMTPATINPAIPVNGRTTAVTNLSYSTRYSGQQSYHSSYATTMAPSHYGSNTTASSTTVTSIGGTGARSSAPTTASHAYQSSDEMDRAGSSYHPQPPVRTTGESYAYKEYPYHSSASAGGQAIPAAMTSSPSPSSAVRKRESPLDLSVKTIKTSADSTAQDDLELSTGTDKQHASSSSLSTSFRSANMTRSMLPPSAQSAPSQSSYLSSYDSRPTSNSARSSTACVRASTPQTVCAPKVDFLPDFNSAPLRHHQTHENALRRSTAQQLYVPPAQPLSSHQTNNTAPLPHMSTFKKRPLPTTTLYESLSIPPPSSLSSSSSLLSSTSSSSSYLQPNDSVSRFSRYHPIEIDQSRVGPATLPAHNYPPDASKYYLDSRTKFGQQFPQREHMSLKRTGGDSIYATSPSKQPRIAWPVSADKQIEQKLSSANAFSEQQKRQEMSLPVPPPNGVLGTPGIYDQRSDNAYSVPESASRYQQAYCDKRNYPESKVVRSSPTYSHSVASKPTSVHSSPQHLSSSQPIYSSYRQGQKPTCPPSGTSSGQLMDQPSNAGADKRVLSLLRNSLENKQQREEQLNSQQPILVNHSQQSFQNKVNKLEMFYRRQFIFITVDIVRLDLDLICFVYIEEQNVHIITHFLKFVYLFVVR